MTVGVLGYGRMGEALVRALADASYEVLVARRRSPHAQVVTPRSGVTMVEIPALLREADVLVPAVPFQVVCRVMADSRAGSGAGRTLVDLSNPRMEKALESTAPEHRSAGEELAALLPSWRVVKAFNTVPAGMMAVPVVARLPVSLPIASDHDCAKAQVGDLARRLGFDPVDAGGIGSSRELESLATLLASVSSRHGLAGRVAFHLTRQKSFAPSGYPDERGADTPRMAGVSP